MTQQYVKNILKYSAKTKAEREAAEADTYRKVSEMRYAVALEKKFSKEQMLEKYQHRLLRQRRLRRRVSREGLLLGSSSRSTWLGGHARRR